MAGAGRPRKIPREQIKLYYVYNNFVRECSNHTHMCYKWYGGKGVKVCKEWSDFKGFKRWALSNGYKLNSNKVQYVSRKDKRGDFSPSNCDIVTSSRDVCKTRLAWKYGKAYTYKGKTGTMIELAKQFGLQYMTVWYRVKHGVTDAEQLFAPRHQGRKKWI